MTMLHVKQLYAGIPTANDTKISLYTVAAGYRVVLRNITLNENQASTPYIVLYLNTPRILTKYLAANEHYVSSEWIVGEPGDVLYALVQTGKSVSVELSGSLYTI